MGANSEEKRSVIASVARQDHQCSESACLGMTQGLDLQDETSSTANRAPERLAKAPWLWKASTLDTKATNRTNNTKIFILQRSLQILVAGHGGGLSSTIVGTS